MAVKTLSPNKKFFRLSTDPAGFWTCVECLSLVLPANRPAHAARCDKVTKLLVSRKGFGV